MNILIRNAYKVSIASLSITFYLIILNLTVLILLEAFHPPF